MKAAFWRAASVLVMTLSASIVSGAAVVDHHSFANTDAFKAVRVALDLRADFDRKRLSGHADLTLDRLQEQAREIAHVQHRPRRHEVAGDADEQVGHVLAAGERPRHAVEEGRI